jgi:starvation-inducible outer membrane lipoprotein
MEQEMKTLAITLGFALCGCEMMPIVIEGAKEAIEFEEDAIIHEIELREKTSIRPSKEDQRSQEKAQ